MKKKISVTILLALLSFTFLFSSCFGDYFSDSGQIEYVEPYLSTYSTDLVVGDILYLDWYYQYQDDDYAYLVSSTGAWDLFRFWSSDTSVISVGQHGKITAKAPGTATIYVNAKNSHSYYSGFSITYTVTEDIFLSRELAYMELEKSRLTLNIDSIYNMYYYLYSFDGYLYGGAVTVKSSDTSVFTASTVSTYAGYVVITPVDQGTATLTVTSKDKPSISATCSITIKDNFVPTGKVRKINLSETELSLDKNESFQLFATSFDAYGYAIEDPVTWSSNNTSVAEVSKGVVTGISRGTTIITAKSRDNPNISTSCYVTVSSENYIKITDIQFTSETYKITRGESLSIKVQTNPSSFTKPLDWSQSSTILSLAPSEQDYSTCVVSALAEGTCVLSVKSADGNAYANCTITVTKPAEGNAKQYFWGTWVRMDKGTEIVIDEKKVSADGTDYSIFATSTNEVLNINGSIGGIKSFTKKSKNVMEAKIGDAVIPFYRKGGTNLEYTLKVVGFADTVSRAAGSTTVGKAGIKVKGTSTRYTNYEDEGTTDASGEVSLTAPTQGDIQTVTVQIDDSNKITVENLKIENDKTYMGIIPIVEENTPILKVSGYIDETQKTDGYMYSENSYIMTVNIKNISNITAYPSVLEIKAEDDSIISIEGVDGSDGISTPSSFTIPTLKGGKALVRKIKVNVKNFSDAYINTRILVNVHSTIGVWEDYIPLRVYSGNATFTIAASGEYNPKAALNGFIIYPDGNNQFFTVKNGDSIPVIVPRFKSNDSYMLVFSGATTDGMLDETTELYYTVSLNEQEQPFTYNNLDAEEKFKIIYYGGDPDGNETEDTPCTVKGNFEAYIAEGDIDFYTVQLTD